MSNFRLFCLALTISMLVVEVLGWFPVGTVAGFERRFLGSLFIAAMVVGLHGDRRQRK